jgi:trk system potassium uptake protein TrkH
MPPSILLWRSTVQWLGGLGIIGLAIIILPFLRIGGMQLFRMESSDRSEDVLPKARHVAGLVGRVYVALTLACCLTYWALGMSLFDALNHALTTLPTAGFSTHDASFGHFNSPALEWAGVVFMISGALPLLASLRVLRPGGWRDRVDPQIPVFVGMLTVFVLIVTVYVWATGQLAFFPALTKAAFNITSVVTTTGFASTDYLKWGPFVAVWFLLFTFPGGCTGSTAGGIKTFRLIVLYRLVVQHVKQLLHPHRISPIRYGRKVLSGEELGSVGTFVFLYMATFVVFSVAVSLTGLDMATAMSAVSQGMANAGPGIGPIIGPAGNYSSLSDVAKVLLSIAMIVGRLEIQGVLILFLPSFYR